MVIVLFKVPCVIYSMTTMEKRGVLSELGPIDSTSVRRVSTLIEPDLLANYLALRMSQEPRVNAVDRARFSVVSHSALCISGLKPRYHGRTSVPMKKTN